MDIKSCVALHNDKEKVCIDPGHFWEVGQLENVLEGLSPLPVQLFCHDVKCKTHCFVHLTSALSLNATVYHPNKNITF